MRLIALACLLVVACAPAMTSHVAAPIAPTPGPGVGGPAMHSVAMANGLVIDVPTVWAIKGDGIVNRATHRSLLAANVDPASLPLVPGNGDVDTAALPPGTFTLEVEAFCRLSCAGPADETPFPDLSTAQPMAPVQQLTPDHHQLGVSMRWFDMPLFVVARWADPAPSEIALLPAIVSSLRPSAAPPRSGEYNGWVAVGQLADLPVGSVLWEPVPSTVSPSARIYDAAPFFVVRGKQGVYAFVALPLHDIRCVIYYDSPDDRFRCTVDQHSYEWTRFGTYLGPEPLSDLPQHRVIVRDGIVWVQFTRDSLANPTVPNEAAEY